MIEIEKKDLAEGRPYSLRRSMHEAIRKIAGARGYDSYSKVVAEAVEVWIASEYGEDWRESLDEQIAKEARYRRLKLQIRREADEEELIA